MQQLEQITVPSQHPGAPCLLIEVTTGGTSFSLTPPAPVGQTAGHDEPADVLAWPPSSEYTLAA